MSSNYIPKNDGEVLLRYQIARVRSRITKMERDGKEYSSPIVSIPLLQAMDLVERHKLRKNKLETLANIAGELSFQLDNEYISYNVTGLRNLANKILVKISEIK